MKKSLKDYWPFAILIAAVAIIFSPTWGRFIVLPSPDSAPAGFSYLAHKLNECLSGLMGIDLHDLLELALPPYRYCDITYPIDTVVIAIGLCWFLRSRGLGRTAAALGGGLFALMGYSLTLVSAGHRGFFFLTVNAMLMFALLARGISGKGFANYALAGIAAAWAIRRQTDFAVIYYFLAAIYFTCVAARKALAAEDRRACLIRSGGGFAIAAAAFAIAVAPTFRSTLLSTLAERQETVAKSGPAQGSADAATDKEDADAKWIFTTNWSLPPDETLEFVAPAVMGRQTTDPDLPYWGRLGRTWKWEDTHQGFMNFRQHLVYIGAIPLFLALLAMLAPFHFKTETADFKFEIRFWLIVWVISLLLSFGRYTPFYRLFYALPYISFMRAPVKFVRLVELSTAILAAIGAQAVLDPAADRRPFRRMAAIAGVVCATFTAFAAAVAIRPSLYLSSLMALGADARLVSIMSANAVHALLHPAIGFGVVAAAMWWRGHDGARPTPPLAAMALAAAIGAVIAERPFAAANDIAYKYSNRNPVTQMALEGAPAHGRPSVWSAIPNRGLDYALKQNLASFGVDDCPHDNFDQTSFFRAAGPDAAIRAMELSGCQYAVVPASQAPALPKGRLEPVCGLAPRNSPALFEKTMSPGKDDCLIVRVGNPLPDAQLFTRWTSSTDDTLLNDAALKMRGDWSRWTLPVVGAPETCPPDAVLAPRGGQKVTSVLGVGGARRTRVEVDAPADGYLLLRRDYWDRNAAWVDGKPSPQRMAGYHQSAVFVPAGRHVVEFSNIGRSPAWTPVMVLVLVAFAAGLVRETLR